MTGASVPERDTGGEDGVAAGACSSTPDSFVAAGGHRAIVAGAGGGCGGAGATLALAGGSVPLWLGAGLVCGAMTGLIAGPYVTDPGDGLVRGLAIGVVSWVLAVVGLGLARPGTMMGRPIAFPLFMRATLGLGAPAGLCIGAVVPDAPLAPGSARRLGLGGVAGLGTGAVYATPAVRDGLVGSLAVAGPGWTAVPGSPAFYLLAAVLGGLFTRLFGAELHGAGSALLYGLGYGLFWWLLGALTLVPALRTGTVAWTAGAAAGRLGLLIGCAVFGIMLGVLYAVLRWIRQGLLVDPDPVAPGTGGRTIELWRASLRGGGASLLGSAAFGLILYQTGELPTVAGLLGRSGVRVGLAVHLTVGTVIGITYGHLFRYEAPDLGGGVLWGVVYGVVWWLLGPLTLLPLLVDGSLAWTTQAIEATVPMLVGHVIYGALTGTAFTALEQRRAAWARVAPRIAAREHRWRRPFATAAPSLWLFVLVTVVVIPATLLS